MSAPPPRQADPEERKWQNELEKRQLEALPNVQKAAEKWSGTIASLTGVFGIAALIKGRGEISELTTAAAVSVAGLLAVALSLAFAAIYLAALAAQGVPFEVYRGDASFHDIYLEKTKDAARRLQLSRKLVILATGALAAAIGLMWFGPEKEGKPRGASVIVTRRSGAIACGELTELEGGTLALKPKAEGTQPLPLDDVIAVTPVARCP